MKRAILFRYHDHAKVCAERIALLRRLNPDLPIWGLYGGPEKEPLHELALDHDYKVPFEDARFKWEHGDLCVRAWFNDVGHHFAFDMLHVIEWDLLVLEPLDKLLAHIVDGVGLSNLSSLKELRANGWMWITIPDRIKQFDDLTEVIQIRHGITLDPDQFMAGVFPAASMSRPFLERYGAEDIPVLTHDEIRMAAFATAYGLPIRDTGFARDNAFWNCEKAYFTPEAVHDAITAGHKIFHPVKDVLAIQP